MTDIYDQYEFGSSRGTITEPEHGKDGGFQFGSIDERRFISQGNKVGDLDSIMEQKTMFTTIEMNLFVPKDPNQITFNFNINDMIEDDFESLQHEKYVVILFLKSFLIPYLQCEVMGYSTVEAILMKSIENFNNEFIKAGSPIRLINDIQHFYLRIAKKKNGKPNSDYPRVNLSLNIADVGFDNFCLMYTAQGIVNTLTMSSLSKQQTKGGIRKDISSQNQTTRGTGTYEGLTLAKQTDSLNDSRNFLTTGQNDDSVSVSRQQIMANNNQQACCNACIIF